MIDIIAIIMVFHLLNQMKEYFKINLI